MDDNINRSCGDCRVTRCINGAPKDKGYPAFCVTKHTDPAFVQDVVKLYDEEENRKVMEAAAGVECDYYCQKTRVEETIEFAKRIGAKKIGIATCAGLIRETGILTKILRSHGFEVYGVACKAGIVKKVDVGLPEDYEKAGINICNPILQAEILNKEKTDLNIVMGLCVGHDSLFYKYAKGLTTTLVAKDRVLGHNPAAALYTAESYYHNKLIGGEQE
ncbi:Uncharacterized metal-binding protein conserved in archaea [uncultured Roseburia sp.]|uniref:DUF1847 domain-containing protein n=1 Tax=Brotonthovivens ammoniilytica TaxID=2981725 RepID=A0ABT2TLB1_9FIRM|nr:DUF1847 domain-containing protein [Brotonthovivens ammoniilytica]MCU6762481.1 DUF1847 domain-containing protein [Brotonthovivens ammoniilytica]SCI73216.1 Uncharacterized metal-binding protein conserved in archaea [uncultured Roseburia sp.]